MNTETEKNECRWKKEIEIAICVFFKRLKIWTRILIDYRLLYLICCQLILINMLPFNQNLARLSIKVSSRSIIRRKISDDERNPTGSHEIVTSLFLLVCFYLSFLILWTDQFFALFLPALTITCNSKKDREITRTEKKKMRNLTLQFRGFCSEVFSVYNLKRQLR